jgi:NCS2 family nucleobase:cation symporter-2
MTSAHERDASRSIRSDSARVPTRPADLIYWLDDCPPIPQLLLLAFQHVAVICPYLVFATLILREAHASVPVATSAVSLAMLGIAIMTVLQVQRFGWIGSGFLAPPVVSAIYFAPAIQAADRGGIAAVCGMTIMAGLFEALFAWILPRSRKIFSPVVSGLIVMAVAAELGLIGIHAFLGLSSPGVHLPIVHSGVSTPALITAFLTLSVMVSFGVWGRGLARLLCGLVGLVLGLLVAIPMGLFAHEDLAAITITPLFAVPNPMILSYRILPDLIVPFVIAALASGLRTIGVITTAERINDAGWNRPDLPNVSAGVMADGFGCALGGLLAAPGLSTSPSLVGLEKVTGATSRAIAYAIAGWFVVLACLPRIGALLLTLPLPVIGAALVFNASSMFMGGVQIVTSRPVTMRTTFIIGVSFLFALSREAYPQFYLALPLWAHQFTGSILTIGVICGVVLNAIFLIGERRVQSVIVKSAGSEASVELDHLLKTHAKEWQIKPADLERAEQSIDGLLRLIEAGGHADGSLQASISYDDFDLRISIKYDGSLPYVASEQRLPAGMVEEQIFAVGLSGFLSAVVPDRLDSSCDNGKCEIRLYFET